MKRLLSLAVLCLSLTQCVTPDGYDPQPGGGPRYRYVSMPYDLNERELQYIRDVTGVLEANGYRPTRGGNAEYSLDFSIEEGPINTDTSITLSERGSTIAEGEGRDGGPQSIFDRAGVVRRSFDRALREFSSELGNGGGYDRRDNDYNQGYPAYPY